MLEYLLFLSLLCLLRTCSKRGGTHAYVVWMVRFYDACRSTICSQSAQDCFFDLVDFAKRQWNEQFHNIKGEEHSLVEEATASDVAEFLPVGKIYKNGYRRRTRGVSASF